tara:strand:+ start:313 stop:1269 length:957 start_codon:yes stop_codon:yes gene_type:complete
MDVTPQILQINRIYGASDNTQPSTLSASRSLNYAEGPSIQRPSHENLNVIPFIFRYADEVGLFGAENHFVRINVEVDRDFSLACYEGDYYECADIDYITEDLSLYYSSAEIDLELDKTTVNTYEPAEITLNAKIPLIYDPYISVELINLKTGNQYYDNWLSVSLYTKEREPIAEDHMYIRLNDFFYVGFHALDTRRIPYNVEVKVGEELRSGLPSTECNDEWEIRVDDCACIEEEDWVCAEMTLWTDVSPFYEYAEVDPTDINTVNSYQAARATLQGTECIIDTLSDYLQMPRRGNVGQVPPPKQHKMDSRDPCCSTC